MKNHIIFAVFAFLLNCSTTKVRSQNYYPLPFDSGVWQEEYVHTSPNVWLSRLDLFYFNGDTIIDGVTYKKMINEGSSNGFYKGYYGAMRQDTFEQKVYFIDRDSLTEAVLYEFDLSVGDTLKFLNKYDIDNPLTDSVVLVDSIGLITIDNTERRQFFYHVDLIGFEFPESGSIIEGVGNTHGFVYPLVSPYSGVYNNIDLTCVSVNGIQIFGDTSVCFQPGHFIGISSTVDPFTSVHEFQTGDQIVFQLSNPNNKSIRLSIVNMLGQIEKTLELNSSQNLSFSRSEFSIGTHIATITSNDESVSSLKFVVF
jgi:hypothetical protein